MSLGDVLRILADERKRQLMYVFKESDKEVFKYDELTDKMLEEDYLAPEDKEIFKTKLVHNYLPMMEEADIIEIEENTDVIFYKDGDYIEDILETVREHN